MMFRERRRYLRHPIGVPLRIRRIGASEEVIVSTRDLSQGGLLFFCAHALHSGDELEISFPVKDRCVRLKGKVAYSAKDSENGLFRTGLEFLDADEAFKAKLAEELLEIERYRLNLTRALKRQVSEEEASEKWVKERARKFAGLYT